MRRNERIKGRGNNKRNFFLETAEQKTSWKMGLKGHIVQAYN